MGDLQHFCLRWNNYQNSITTAFENLRGDEDFIDVTLACDGKTLKAHRVVLSACSPYFRELLKSTPCKHPVIVLQDVVFDDLHALVEFIYHGEVNVHQRNLTSFLKTAEVLKVSGLTQTNSATATPTSSSPSSDHYSDNLSTRFTTRSPSTPPEKGNPFQPQPPLFNSVQLTNSNDDRNSPRTIHQQNRHRRHIRSPTPIRSSNSRDVSPVPPMKRAKSVDNPSPSQLNSSTNVSPTTVLGEDTTVRPRKNSCDGSPPSRRNSPHDTSDYDENHNPAQATSREEEIEEPMDPMDFSNKNPVKKYDSAQLPPSKSASPKNQPLKSEPIDLACNQHTNSNNTENDNENNNPYNDDDSSQWDRLSDQSPPPTNTFPPALIDHEDTFQSHRNFFDTKLFHVAPSLAFADAFNSLSNINHHQNHPNLPASAVLDGLSGSSQDWTEVDRRGSQGPGGGGGGVGAGVGGGQQQHGCFICGKMLSTRLTLKRHIEQQHHQPLHSAVCTICHKVFRTLNSLNNHKSIYHRKPKWNTPSSTINS